MLHQFFIAKLSHNLYKGEMFCCKRLKCWQIHHKIQNIFQFYDILQIPCFVYVASILFIAKLSDNLYEGEKLCCKKLKCWHSSQNTKYVLVSFSWAFLHLGFQACDSHCPITPYCVVLPQVNFTNISTTGRTCYCISRIVPWRWRQKVPMKH
jgi:hypothetical protein